MTTPINTSKIDQSAYLRTITEVLRLLPVKARRALITEITRISSSEYHDRDDCLLWAVMNVRSRIEQPRSDF